MQEHSVAFYINVKLTEAHPCLVAAGVYSLAGAWSARGEDPGWVPAEVVAHWDHDLTQAAALVALGLWAEETLDGEDGYRFLRIGDVVRFRPPNRPAIPAALRAAVFARDGHRCLWCDTAERLTLDHVEPYKLDGPDTLENLQTLCLSCNSRKGARVEA
jgi:hypothetical protein